MSVVECVPNFSDGRDPAVLAALVAAIDAVEGAVVLDASRDEDHNRAVVTFAADPGAALEAGLEAMRVAIERIDLRTHTGVHPRMGATDVFPFVPIGEATLDECARLARVFGERVGRELEVPVFLYGAAATRPERARLPDVRRGGFERLRDCIGKDPACAPDHGPARIHPTAGATAVGARELLLAFNVVLDSHDVELARRIAAAIREANGGLPGVRALGLFLESSGAAQVSTNVTEYRRCGLERVYDEVQRLAAEHGVEVAHSELVGLAPAAALDAAAAARMRLSGFDPQRSIVERRLEASSRRAR